MKKLFYTLFAGLWLALSGTAQSLAPSVISSGGTNAQAGGVILSYTVGEAGGVNTATSGGIILTQGFQQVEPIGSTGGAGNKPAIFVTSNLNTFTASVGNTSTVQSFTVSGSNLTGNISLSAPTYFEISLSSSSGFGAALNLTPISGSVATTVIYVRFAPAVSGQQSGNISCTSAGATTQNVALNGTTGSIVPSIVTSVSALSAFSTNVGTPSSAVGFTVTGNDLTANLVVTAPTHFEVSTSSASGFGSSVSITPTSGKVNAQTIYVRYNPSASGSHGGNISCASTGATTQNVAVTGNSTGNPIPTIVASTSSLSAFTTSAGTPSSVQSFTVSGNDLSANLSLSAPSTFEISQNAGSGFGSAISLTPASGIVNNTTIYVRYNPTAVGNHNGNIVCASTGATSKNVSVTGTATAGASTPVITVSTSALTAFSTTFGNQSSEQNFTISGKNLKGVLTLDCPPDYEMSTTSGSGFSPFPVNLYPTGGTIATTTIYVRYNPLSNGQHSGVIECASTGAVTQNIIVNGSTTGNISPVIISSVASLIPFSTSVGTPSTAQLYNVMGTDLNGLLVVSAPSDFQVSLNALSGFGGSVNFNPVNGKVTNGIVYVRYNPTTSGAHAGNVDNASSGATTVSVFVSGNATMPAGPVVTATNIPSTFTTTVGQPSLSQAMAVSGSNLVGDITVMAPTQFEVSLSSGSGYTNALQINQSGGTVNTKIIYVRYNPSAAGAHNGNITVSSQGANTQLVAVDGVSAAGNGVSIIPSDEQLIELFPNPSHTYVYINYNLLVNNKCVLQICDMNGKVIHQMTKATETPGLHQTSFDVSSLAGGIYICKLFTSNGMSALKFIVE